MGLVLGEGVEPVPGEDLGVGLVLGEGAEAVPGDAQYLWLVMPSQEPLLVMLGPLQMRVSMSSSWLGDQTWRGAPGWGGAPAS